MSTYLCHTVPSAASQTCKVLSNDFIENRQTTLTLSLHHSRWMIIDS